ncbi:hypothetical protein N865_03600 [Intrasporangium oryzae NRRL B-24470]|uniref:DUF4282 domain-containing protein n=1 Tax=Intrasporangium oryzae NRRL B-24470 TaxID=1386089 RepID=W9GE57_9MICO|nr:hypothetical protein N865_03600 [Intrasporangium oryzae NRRL B-24470]
MNPPEQRPSEPEPGDGAFQPEQPAGTGAPLPPPPPQPAETAPLQPSFGASSPPAAEPVAMPPVGSPEPVPPPPATGLASAGGYGGSYAAAPGGAATPGPGPAPVQGLTAGMGGGSGGFVQALFDYGFNTFVTPKIVKFVYVLATIWIAVIYVVYVITAFTDSVGYGVIVLVIGALFAFIWLAVVRIGLEFAISVVRMSEDVHKRLPQA